MNIYALALVLSVICGLVAAVIASRKGRDPVKWFFVGAALNLFGLAAVLFIQRRREVSL